MSNTPTAEEFLRALPPVLRNDRRMMALGQVVAEELSDRMSEIEKAAIYTSIRHLRGCEPQGVALDWKNTDIFLSSLQPSTICMMVICWRENISAIRIVCLSTPISLRII